MNFVAEETAWGKSLFFRRPGLQPRRKAFIISGL